MLIRYSATVWHCESYVVKLNGVGQWCVKSRRTGNPASFSTTRRLVEKILKEPAEHPKLQPKLLKVELVRCDKLRMHYLVGDIEVTQSRARGHHYDAPFEAVEAIVRHFAPMGSDWPGFADWPGLRDPFPSGLAAPYVRGSKVCFTFSGIEVDFPSEDEAWEALRALLHNYSA